MAIEKVKRLWLLVERNELDPFVESLAASQTVHVIDLEVPSDEPDAEPEAASNTPPEDERASRAVGAVAPPEATGLDEAQQAVSKLSRAAAILDEFQPPKKPLYQLFVSLPTEIPRAEFDRAVRDVDPGELYDEVTDLHRKHGAAEKKAHELRARIDQLSPWAAAPCPPPGWTRCEADLGVVTERGLAALTESELETFAARPVATIESETLVAAAWLPETAGAAREVLEAAGFESLDVDPRGGTIDDVLGPLRRELAETEERRDELADKICSIAERRTAVTAALAHWQTEVEERRTFEKGLASKRIVVLSGYVLVREMPRLEELLADRWPSVGLVAKDPTLEEDVPVSLGGRRLYRPAQFLTSLFGLPDYFDFDPSPYIFFVFLVFVGFCFGDAVYGLGLLALGWWLARKARRYPSTAHFFSLMAWCGAASVVFGVLSGSWLSDLVSERYLGSGPVASALIAARTRLALFDLMDRPLIGLGLALGIGVLTQFYGIGLLIYRRCRRRDYFAAFSDGVLWLIFLPGLTLLLGAVAANLPSVWFQVGLWATLLSALGLVLTQGRHEESPVAKAIVGLVSLYGILGSYGTTSFLSDALSYSRLLALGLATVVIGMAANYIAELARRAPFVGLLLFLGFLAVGHLINFLVSILSGFVHSVRLIFVEMFSRFYEGGGRPFAPLGVPESVRVIDES